MQPQTKKMDALEAEPLKRSPYLPVSLEERAKEKAFYREQQQKDQPRLLDCLDPTVAKRYQDAKPLYEWKVECRIFRMATAKNHAKMEDVTEQVVAEDEDDAWAYFCDIIGEWPSRRATRPKITRLKRRTLRDGSEDTEVI